MPPEPTYTIVEDVDDVARTPTIRLNERADWQYSDHELNSIEPFTMATSRGERIAGIYIRCPSGLRSRYTILFSHGNAVDVGQMASFLVYLSARLQCNILTYDYAGYGASTGAPTEANIYADVDAAWRCLVDHYGLSPDQVILYGQSIGTVPTVDLASRIKVAGVILHSPLTSGVRVAFPDTKQTWFFDAFPSIDKVEKITSPVLVIHGKDDEVIDFSHGQAIYERCPHAVDPLWVEGAGHNDVEHFDEYIDRLTRFVNHDLRLS